MKNESQHEEFHNRVIKCFSNRDLIKHTTAILEKLEADLKVEKERK